MYHTSRHPCWVFTNYSMLESIVHLCLLIYSENYLTYRFEALEQFANYYWKHFHPHYVNALDHCRNFTIVHSTCYCGCWSGRWGRCGPMIAGLWDGFATEDLFSRSQVTKQRLLCPNACLSGGILWNLRVANLQWMIKNDAVICC